MRKTLVATAAVALALVPAAASAQDGEAEVVAVHGIPQSVFDTLGADSTEVDVYAADSYDAPLVTFEFGDTGALSVPAGTYTLEVYPAGADPESNDPVIDLADAELAAGSSTSVVAQLDEAGETPSLTAYANETGATGIQVFHAAAFGPVDVIADGAPALEGAANGDTARIDVPGGTTVPGVGIAPAGGDVALEVGDVEVPDATLVLAYAVGAAADDSLQVVTATVAAQAGEDDTGDGDDAETPVPHSVDAGSGGLATDRVPVAVLVAMLLGAAMLTAPMVARVRARR